MVFGQTRYVILARVYVCAFGPSQLWIFNASLILTKRPARQLMEDVLGVLASLVKNFSFEISSLQIYDKRNLFFCFFPLQSLLDFALPLRFVLHVYYQVVKVVTHIVSFFRDISIIRLK